MGINGNLFTDIPEALPEELIEVILRTGTCRIERIVSRGHNSPEGFWYDQDENEWVLLLKGKASLLFEDQDDVIIMNTGDYVNIDRHRKHRVEFTDLTVDTIWLVIHYS